MHLAGQPQPNPAPLRLPSPCWFGRGYLCWILHSLWRLRHWGGWWEEGIWWVDKLKRQKQTNWCKSIILGARCHSLIHPHRCKWLLICTQGKFSQVLFSKSAVILCFWCKNQELYSNTNNKGEAQWQSPALKGRGEKHFLSTYYMRLFHALSPLILMVADPSARCSSSLYEKAEIQKALVALPSSHRKWVP